MWAAVALASTSRRAVVRRSALNGSIVSPDCASTSSRVTRPPRPVPCRRDGSIPRSVARRRTAGDRNDGPPRARSARCRCGQWWRGGRCRRCPSSPPASRVVAEPTRMLAACICSTASPGTTTGWRSPMRWPTSASAACRGRSTTGRSRSASRAGCSSRSRARATRRWGSASPVSSAPGTTGSSRTTATARWCSGSACRRSTSCCRRSGAPTIPRRAGGRCRATGATASATSSRRAAPPGASACPRWDARRRRATSCGGRCPGCTAYGDEVVYVSLGEGATSEGEFWESLNTACRLGLPVLYVVADNGYAISVRATDQAPAPISTLVRGFTGLHVTKLDGLRLLRRAPQGRGGDPAGACRSGPGPDPRDRHPAVLALTVRRPEQVPHAR